MSPLSGKQEPRWDVDTGGLLQNSRPTRLKVSYEKAKRDSEDV